VLVDRVNNIHLDEEGKQAAVLLKVIEAINNLMGLHRDPLRQAQVDLTRAQTELVHTMMAELRGQMLERTMAGVRAVLREFDLREDQVELVRTGLESAWGGWFRDAYDVSVKTIKEVEG
jgi:3-methyladenine DNA glycosylase Mpg